ncbi:MAG TPA: FAD-binding oxidoreductase [Acetobacteraceae bacterium]|nr:FAD-binding oxidoreductase [Acetobacteraceae bacterium]
MIPRTPSLYADTAVPAPETPPLDGDRRTMVAVIGGGFTGLSTALHLAERGVDVTLIEAYAPGWGASGRNGGQVNPGLKHDPDQVEKDHGTDLGRRMIALSWNAPNAVFALIERHQLRCEALQSGTIRAGSRGAAAASVRASAEQGMRRGMPVALLEGAALAEAVGHDRYECAMLDRSGGHVNPLSYARELARVAIRQGAKIHGETQATRLRLDGGAWQVETPRGTITAEHVVIATNGYSGDLWPGLRRSIVPAYSAIAATAPLAEHLAARIMPIRSSLYEMGRSTIYYRVDANNRLLIGGRSAQRDIAGPDALGHLRAYAERLWPALKNVQWSHGWSGQPAITPDYYPHLHAPAPNLLIALGYSGRGVAMSTVMGMLLAKRIAEGEAARLDMPLTDIRTIPLHGMWKTAVYARLAYNRVVDRMGRLRL